MRRQWPLSPLLLRVVSILSILAVWLLFAHVLGPRIVPGPLATLEFAAEQLERGALTLHVWATVRRVLLALVIGMALGLVVGTAMGTFRSLDQLLEAWVVAGLTVPRIMLFVVAYLMLGLSELAIILALVLTITPNIVVQIREGTQAVDQRLIQMARAYRRSHLAIWRNVVFPQLLPYTIGTARSSLSMAWRLVMLGELLGRTSGVGYQIYFYFQMFQMTGILAYGLAMMVILSIIDLGIMGGLQRLAFHWRRAA